MRKVKEADHTIATNKGVHIVSYIPEGRRQVERCSDDLDKVEEVGSHWYSQRDEKLF